MNVSLAFAILGVIVLIRAGGNWLSLRPPKPRGEFAGRETPTNSPAKRRWLEDRARGEARLIWVAPALLVAAVVAWVLGY